MSTSHCHTSVVIIAHLLFYGGFGVAGYWIVAPIPAAGLLLAAVLIWVSVVDLDRYEIPDLASLSLFVSGLWTTLWGPFVDYDHVLAGILWPLIFWAVGYLYERYRGFQGLGFGDVKLISGIGLWLGLVETTLVVCVASLGGILTILVLGLRQSARNSPIQTSAVAFGPYLCLSTWVNWLF